MEGMLKEAEVQAVNLVGAWEKGNTNQRQELAKAFFPEGLVFSHQLKFFEPANPVLTEMLSGGWMTLLTWRPRRDLNPCYRRERAVS